MCRQCTAVPSHARGAGRLQLLLPMNTNAGLRVISEGLCPTFRLSEQTQQTTIVLSPIFKKPTSTEIPPFLLKGKKTFVYKPIHTET